MTEKTKNPMTEEELDELFTADAAGGTFEPLEDGMYPAVCCGIVVREMPSKFKEGLQKKFNYIFQVVQKNEDGKEEIYWLKSKLFTKSSNEKATLVKDILVPWTGASLERIQSRFKMRSMIGYPAQVVVVTTEKDGHTRSDITSIVKPKKNASRDIVPGTMPYYITKDALAVILADGVKEGEPKKEDVEPVQGLPGGLAEGMQANFQAGQPVNDAAPDFGLATPTVPQNKMPKMPPAAKVTQNGNPAEFMGVTNPPPQPQTGVVQEDDSDSSDLPF